MSMISLCLSHPSQIDHLLSFLASVFLVKYLGQLSFFLGIKICHLDNGILLSQRKFICDLLSRVNMFAANGFNSPMTASS